MTITRVLLAMAACLAVVPRALGLPHGASSSGRDGAVPLPLHGVDRLVDSSDAVCILQRSPTPLFEY